MDFPLERTHREIAGASASEVADRISKALRVLSIDAEYDCEQAKAKCTSSDMVNFRIRLFAGGEDGLPVVVEVQRRSGSASSFMRSCRAILDAAEGKKVDAACAGGPSPPSMKVPLASMKCLQGVSLAKTSSSDMASGLERCMELLRSDKKDTNLLGLENLAQMTDALKTRPDIAVRVAKVLVIGDEKYDIREDVAVALQRDAFSPDDEQTVRAIADSSRHSALVAFSNALSLTSKDGCLKDAVRTQPWFAQFLIPSLLDELKLFTSSANNAYEAACGLTSLATCSEFAQKVMKDYGAKDELQAANAFGADNHELLANETERCMKALE